MSELEKSTCFSSISFRAAVNETVPAQSMSQNNVIKTEYIVQSSQMKSVLPTANKWHPFSDQGFCQMSVLYQTPYCVSLVNSPLLMGFIPAEVKYVVITLSHLNVSVNHGERIKKVI